MIKLFVDPISHLVTGYEFLSEYSIRYMDDIVLTEEESLNFKLVHGETYYENEKIIYEKDRDNYHKEIAQLKEELARTSVKTKEELLSNFILNDDMTDIVKIKSKVNDEYNKNNKKREELKIKINNITENHFNAIDNYYRNLSKQKDDAVNPIYKTSICLLAKDEDLYIEEWVNHYINLGFEHIYIYDNGSKNPINDFIKSHFNKEIQKKLQ